MTPVRTCVGCGARDARPALVRFVARDGALVLDAAGRLAGRGAYLHRARRCADEFVARRGPVRSLRVTPARGSREALVAALVGDVVQG